MESKSFYRARVRDILKESNINWAEIGLKISESVKKLPEYSSSRIICGFAAMSREPDMMSIYDDWLFQGKELYLPRYLEDGDCYEMARISNMHTQLRIGNYGIQEPVDGLPAANLQELQGALWLIPGLSFCCISGVRLGRGRGYYDRLLSKNAGLKVGVAAECQLSQQLPYECHDVRMNLIITENRICRIGG